MPNIVFIDHDIENYHANTFADLLAEEGSEFRLAGVFANRKDNLTEWAEARQVPAVARVEDLAALADFVMVLAPSNPETHEELCRAAFALGKPTYVDKTFAPDLAAATRIFAEADQCAVPVQTASVLRYTEVQEFCRAGARAPKFVATWASGGNFAEYIIHPVEHVISLMGPDIEAIEQSEVSGFTLVKLSFSGGRSAHIHMHVNHGTPFFSVVTDEEETRVVSIDGGNLFRAGLRGILSFFENPQKAIDRRETLAVMRVLDVLRTKMAG